MKKNEIEERIEGFGPWLYETRGLSGGTIASYLRTLRTVLRAGGNPYDILRRDHSPAYRAVLASTLRHWAAYTEDAELAAHLDSAATRRLVRRPKTGPGTKRPALSAGELEAFLAILEQRDEPPWARPCIGLMARLGLRSEDMHRLLRADVVAAVASDRLRVVGKGGKVRWLPSSPVKGELEDLAGIRGWEYLWDLVLAPERIRVSGPSGDLEVPSAAYLRLRAEVVALAGEAGIQDMSTHRLRKAAALRLYEASGHDLNRVRKLLGHADPKTTIRYLEVDEDDWISETGAMLGGES